MKNKIKKKDKIEFLANMKMCIRLQLQDAEIWKEELEQKDIKLIYSRIIFSIHQRNPRIVLLSKIGNDSFCGFLH